MAFPSTLYKAASTLVVSCLLLTGTAQVPVSSFSVTPENLINEEFCSQITLENTGNAGYQPYIRLFLPPQITASSLEVQMLGNPVTDVVTVGTFSGSPLDDPNLQEEDPNNLVSGPAGYVWLNVNLPVGSLIEGAITLDVSLCATLNGPGVTADVPLTLETQVVYRFGDTPTGANGSIAGTLMSGQVTPKLYTFGYIVDMGTVVTGGCNYLSYDLIVDIAQQKVVNGLVINAPLPASIKYYDIYGITPGCIITQEPAIGGTGTINVQCNNVVGSDQEEDVKVSFLATVADILNDNSCSEIQVSSAATVVSNQQPTPLSSATGISAMHATFLPVSPSSDVIPGNTVSLGFDLAVSEFVAGLNELTFTCILPDGLSYQNPAWLNGTPINATITANVDGTTELFFDLVAANGGDFAPCDMRTLAFEALILEQYAGGGTVAAGDPLVTLGTVTYDVAGGVDGCTVPYTMGYSVDAPSVLKEIVTAPANGQNYVPGELITYRLTAEIPSGDVNNLVFEDLFPIPVHDVSTLNLTFGTDIDWSPLDNVGITPASISIDATKNKLVVDWGTVSFPTSLSSRIVSIDITIAIASAPFADGLMHTNFGRFSFENSIAESSSDLSLTSIGIGAPLLLFTKGVLTTDQPDAAYSPVMVPINANASNLDAWDWVTYRLTLNNIGDAPAYDVIVNDFPPTPQLGNCQVLSVKNGENTNVPYSGNLFGAGLVVSSVAKYNPSNQTDQVYVEYKCRVQGTIAAQTVVPNEAQATWAAVPGSPYYFDPVTEVAQISIARPDVYLNVINIEPGYAQNGGVHIGELVTYEALVRIPEGRTLDATFSTVLPEGLSIEEFILFERPDEISFSVGSTSQVLAGLSITDIGSGVENQDRMLTLPFGIITNGASDNDEDEYIRLVFSATVLNSTNNQNGHALTQTSTLQYRNPVTGAFTTRTATNTLTVVEPELDMSIAFFNDQLLPGDQTYVTLTVSHKPTSTGTAFDVELVNDLPLGLQFVSGSLLTECNELLAADPVTTFGSLSAVWDSLPLGVSCQLVYTISSEPNFPPCTFVENCTSLKYSSCWDTHLDTLSYGPQNPLGVERKGIGTPLDDYASDSCAEAEIVSPDITTPTIFGNTSICAGQPLNLFVNQYQGAGVNYMWTGPGIQEGFNNYSWSFPQADAAMTGEYQVVVQIGNCFSNPSAPFELSVIQNPVVAVSNVSLTCANGADDVSLVPLIAEGDGPFTFAWNGANYFSNDSIAIIENALPEDQGVYTLQVTDVYGCSSAIVQTLVSITAQPATPVLTGDLELCIGESTTLSATPYLGDVTYYWNTPSGIYQTENNFLNYTPGTGNGGEISVYANVNDCATQASVPVMLTVSQAPDNAVFTVSDTSPCAGETLSFTAGVSAGTYLWSGPNGYQAQTASPPAVEDISILDAGTYTLAVGNGGCFSEPYSLVVNVLNLPQTPALQSDSPVCSGSPLSLETSAQAQIYQWNLPDGTSVTTNEAQYNIAETTADMAGSYTLQVFDGTCFSLPSITETVVIDVIPAEQAFAGESIIACPNSAFTIQAQNASSLTGIWSTDDSGIQIVSPSEATSAVLGAEAGNTYLLTWTLYNAGCGNYSSDEVTVFAPLPPIAADDYQEIVEGMKADANVLVNDEVYGVDVIVTLIDLPDHGTAQVSGDNTIEYTPESGYSGSDALVYEVCFVDCPDQCTTATLRFEVFPFLHVPNIITPNGDGVNDALVIEGIERFPLNRITVYNRWGREIFTTEDYQNNWQGTFNGTACPDGTYFFVFENTDTGEVLENGYFTIHQ